MPIYEYMLEDGTVIEKYRLIRDREAPLPDHPGAELLPSRSHFRSETLFRDHPATGKRTVFNDYDDPYEGMKGEGWAVEASEEFCARSNEAEAAIGMRPERTSHDKPKIHFT